MRHEVDGVEVVVTDDGVGPGKHVTARGFGLKSSVRERMAAAGGTTTIGPGPEGRGTQVVLAWWPQVEHADDDLGPPLLVRAAEIMVAIGLVLGAIASAFIVLGWPGYAYPVAALTAALLPVAVAAWVLDQARSEVQIGASHVVAACATYILVGAVAVLADPSCSSLLGRERHARRPGTDAGGRPAPAAALVGAGRRRRRPSWSRTSAARWRGATGGRGAARTRPGAGVYIVAGLAAAWLFIGRITRLTEQFVLARTEAAEAQVRIGAQVAVRAEQEAWVAGHPHVGAVAAVGHRQRRRQVSDPEVREECASEAQFLRGLLAVGRAPEPTRRPARIWLLLLRVSHCQVALRGSFAALHAADRGSSPRSAVPSTPCARWRPAAASPSRPSTTPPPARSRSRPAGEPVRSADALARPGGTPRARGVAGRQRRLPHRRMDVAACRRRARRRGLGCVP